MDRANVPLRRMLCIAAAACESAGKLSRPRPAWEVSEGRFADTSRNRSPDARRQPVACLLCVLRVAGKAGTKQPVLERCPYYQHNAGQGCRDQRPPGGQSKRQTCEHGDRGRIARVTDDPVRPVRDRVLDAGISSLLAKFQETLNTISLIAPLKGIRPCRFSSATTTSTKRCAPQALVTA